MKTKYENDDFDHKDEKDSKFELWFKSFSDGREKIIVGIMLLILMTMTILLFISRHNQKTQSINPPEYLGEPVLNYERPTTARKEAVRLWDDYQTTLEDEELLLELEKLLKNNSQDTVRIAHLVERLNKYLQNEKN